ncbi:MAG: SPFH domain-containing protein, partial [Cyanobacteria bacterium P01_H01_bin.119]
MRFWLELTQTLPNLAELEAAPAGPRPVSQLEAQRSADGWIGEISPMPMPVAQVPGGSLTTFAGMIVFVVVLLLIAIWAYTRVYVIAPNNEAFVRTGGVVAKKKTVILNGGCVVLPGFHELTRVPLREISIDVERTGKLAVRTQDYLRADMRVTFYVCITASNEDVLTAAARLSNEGKITPMDIKNALEKRADDAIRAAA